MHNFKGLSREEIHTLIVEFEKTDIEGIPPPDSRKWYLLEFVHWILGQIIEGNNPL